MKPKLTKETIRNLLRQKRESREAAEMKKRIDAWRRPLDYGAARDFIIDSSR